MKIEEIDEEVMWCNTENCKARKLINFCHISNLASFPWKEAWLLDSNRWR
jgi:hypothetical protein